MKITIPKRSTFKPQRSGDAAYERVTRGREYRRLGNQLSQLGQQIVVRQRKAKRQIEMQRAREEAERRQAQFLREYNPTEHEELPKALRKWQKEARGEILKELDPGAREAADAAVRGVFLRGLQSGDQLAYEYRTQELAGEHDNYRYEAMRRGSTVDDPGEITEIETTYFQTVDGLVEQGVYTAEKGEKLKRSFSRGIVEDRLQDLMIEQPHVVVNMLDEGAFPRLDSDTRQSLHARAVTAARQKDAREEAEREEAERKREELRKANQDAVFMELYSRSSEGALERETVESMRQLRLLRPSQYTQLVRVLDDPDSADDPQIVRNLELSIMRGEVVDPSEVLNYVGEGVSTATAKDLIDLIGEGSAFVQSRDYKQAVDYLDRQLGVSPGIQISGLSGDEQQRVARARRELYERVNAGEKPWAIVDEMLPRYQRNPSGLPKPRFPGAQAAIDAFSRGSISATVLEQQIELMRAHGIEEFPEAFQYEMKEGQP